MKIPRKINTKINLELKSIIAVLKPLIKNYQLKRKQINFRKQWYTI